MITRAAERFLCSCHFHDSKRKGSRSFQNTPFLSRSGRGLFRHTLEILYPVG